MPAAPMPSPAVDTSALYRMPWTMADNGFSWLEPTRRCNLSCEYCYQRNDPTSVKALAEIARELDGLRRLRRCDVMIIAGGEPLTHPDLAGVVRLVRERGLKPVVLTNGHGLDARRVAELKASGAFGFFFHVDAGQRRPGWTGKNERELNALRQELADLVHDAGDLVCGYNTTVLPDQLAFVPDVVRWTITNADRVAANVLITVRGPHADDGWDYFAGGERIDVDATPYALERRYRELTAADLCAAIEEAVPGYRFHSFLGGTVRSEVPKWLFGTHLADRAAVHGNLGPRAAELLQATHHALLGRFLALPAPRLAHRGVLALALAPFDPGARATLKRLVTARLRRPFDLVRRRLHLQSLIVMQPHDVLPNGEQDECDGCPNKTYWEGRLVSECRKEDYLLWGRPVVAAPRAPGRRAVERCPGD
jgi:Radical SAM superfamily